MNVEQYSSRVILQDGRAVGLRSMRPHDKKRLQRFHARLSERSIYLRFFEFKESLDARDLVYLAEVDSVRHVALVATVREWLRKQIVGIFRYVNSQVHDLPKRAFARISIGLHEHNLA